MIICIVNAQVGDRAGQRVIIRDGTIEEISANDRAPRGATLIDARGGAVVPGLWDHHVHARSAAARRRSIDVGDVRDPHELWSRIRTHAAGGASLRLVGYDSDRLGQLTLAGLEGAIPGAPPIRVQHRSGHHWVVNAAARTALIAQGVNVPPDGILWDEDTGLAGLPSVITDADVTDEFRSMRAQGVVGAADLTATNDAAAAAFLRAAAEGIVTLTVAGTATAARRGEVDGVKLVVHDHLGTGPDEIAAAMSVAPDRPVALHVVTDAALALALSACADRTDTRAVRFEHAFVCPPDAVTALAGADVSVGTHPGFIVTQGDRLIDALTERERRWYQPLRAWVDAGVPLFGGTDAPFGTSDVWRAMQAAVSRRTPRGRLLGAEHALTPEEAFALFTRAGLRGRAGTPTVTVGGTAACVLDRPWSAARRDLGRTRVVAVIGA